MVILFVLEFVYIWDFIIYGLCYGIMCFIFIVMFILMLFFFFKYDCMREVYFWVVVYVILFFMVCFVVLLFFFDLDYFLVFCFIYMYVDGVWQIVFVVFIIYFFVFLRILFVVICGVIILVSYVVVCIVIKIENDFDWWRQVSVCRKKNYFGKFLIQFVLFKLQLIRYIYIKFC